MRKPKKNSWEVGCGVVALLPFVLIILIIVAVGWLDWHEQKKSLDWPSTEATILLHYPPATSTKKGQQPGDLDSLTLNYYYLGQRYSNTYRVYAQDQQHNQLLRLIAKNANRRLVVRVNPQAPQNIHFQQGISSKTYKYLLSGGVMVLLIAWGLSAIRTPSYAAGIQLIPKKAEEEEGLR